MISIQIIDLDLDLCVVHVVLLFCVNTARARFVVLITRCLLSAVRMFVV